MIRINDSKSKTTLKAAVLVSVFLLFASATGFGQQVVNLLAGPATTTMPDGTVLPMWGYSCQALAAGVSSSATCAPLSGASSGAAAGALGGIYVVAGGSNYSSSTMVTITPNQTTAPTTPATATPIVSGGVIVGINLTNPGAGYTAAPTIAITDGAGTGAAAAAGPAWSPVVITVPTTAAGGLTINLTNNLSFPTITGGGTNTVPTSIVIVGQVGGGLGTASTRTLSPDHSNAQGCPTWFIADPNTPPGVPCTANDSGAVPPTQAQGRVQSMATEVTAVAPGTTVTPTALTWAGLKPGTYLLESGTHPSIQAPMGLIGVLVVTTAPSGATAGTAYPGAAATTTVGAIPAVTYNAEVPLEFSEIDPVQNKEVDLAVRTAGFSETTVWSGMAGGCATTHSCYPPAVNYTPFYYLINGVAFNKTAPALSLFQATAGVSGTTPVTTGITGTVLLRLVNAGLRMHVPSIVGSLTQGFNGAGSATLTAVGGFTLIAEDGNVVPGVAAPGKTFPTAPRVQTDVFMAAGKTFDVMVNVPAAGASSTPALPIYDRELSLSANSSVRDAGMVAYVSVNNAVPTSGLPVGVGSGVFAGAQAVADKYAAGIPCASGATSCTPVVVSDPSKGVIANDVNVYGVALSSPTTNGTLTCNALASSPVAGICANGTFTYTPNAGTAGTDSFGYCANGAAPGTANLCTTVTLGASDLAGSPTAINQSYTAKTATYIKVPSPGLLLGNTDPSNLPLTLVTTSVPAVSGVTGGTVVIDPKGGFSVSAPNNAAAATATFSYTVQNSQGRTSASGTVTVNFPAPSNLKVSVVDAQALANCSGKSTCISGLTPIQDYRWIIEEDKTFYVDPNCTTNSSILTPGCPTPVAAGGTIPTFGVQFHTSTLEFVAQGCTGKQSCESGQTMLDNRPACTGTGVPAGCSATAGQHIPAVCDLGSGACRPDSTGNGYTPVMPSSVHLDPSKRYYISVLPGDAGNPFPAYAGAPSCSTTTGANPGDNHCGHTMSGAPIPAACNILGGPNACTSSSAFTQPVTVAVLPTPLPTGKLSVIVFEDDFPLNGEQDGGGGSGTVAPIEPGLGGFNIVLWDTYGGLGDVTGQNSYDMFNQPLSNSLAGTVDPSTGLDACPLNPYTMQSTGKGGLITGNGAGPAPASAMQGMIVTCPKYESDGVTLSPLAGQAVIANLMPEKFSVQAYPGADRIARGEEWLQTNTLDGQHPHDSFIRIGEPSYFQEYGPAGYHVAIGFANPAIINARHADACAGAYGSVGPCSNTISGSVDVERLSRTPDQRLYASGSRDALTFTQCWVSLGDPDSEDFMFTKCDANGNFKFSNVPGGNWRLTIGDEWNDQIIDGLSTPANVGCVPVPPATTCSGGLSTLNLGNIGVQQWQSNIYTRTFIDDNHNGIFDAGKEIGIPMIYTMIHYRDGHTANNLTTDFNGVANFNETFPLFNWYVVEADSGRYKTTGIHTVYDAGGPADGSTSCGTSSNGARACGTSTAYNYLANTFEAVPLPADLSVPGAVYCATADCTAEAATFQAGTAIASPGKGKTASTGRIDPPWVGAEAWSGMTSQGNWIDFGKAPYAPCPPACATVSYTAPGSTTATTSQAAENGGIHGNVTYASTRPFDDASQMIQQPWEPNIPHVTMNLYQESFASDGVTPVLKLVDTTQTTSWDDWAQGFYPGSTAGSGGGLGTKPYMSCPGQGTGTAGAVNQDLFFFTLYDQPNYLDWYSAVHSTPATTPHTLPYNSQFRCYDAMHIWNQLQPAPYDGQYSFPSVLGIDPGTGKQITPAGVTAGVNVGTANFVAASLPGTNCTICVANPTTATPPAPGGDFSGYDPYRAGMPMLPPGKYVVEVVMPPGYEVYKEEDKNLLIGDNFIAPVTQQFGGLGADIFIIPDQASVASMYDPNANGFNPNNYQNQTSNLSLQGDTLSGVPGFPGFQDPLWPCVGEMRVVPDFLSLFPQVQEVAPFAGATRPLCDRKEVTVFNQMSANARFFIYTSTHIASKYTGVITDDFTSEFDPFAPQFGEKFAPPNLSIATKDYLGNELSRVYSDHWGVYDGLAFSSWDVNPPNITGYSPSMMVQCMNDPGPVLDTNPSSPTHGQMITDPLYNPAYSVFCYEEPYMPGLTTYLDTPVVPTEAFVGAAYNTPDCSLPDTTPAIKEVDGDGIGPWVSRNGARKLTITALGDVQVNNSAYSGPSASVAPFNLKTIKRHYGFGMATGKVTVGGVALTGVSWSDGTITGTIPTPLTVPACAVQQQTQYGGPGKTGTPALCGQLLITAANGKQSVDSVTVTIGGKQPKHVNASSTIQSAIDGAAPGDLIIVDPTCTITTGSGSTATTTAAASCTTAGVNGKSAAAHNEMLLMWKPVRLQGVGAASSVIDANAIPAGKLLDPWRRHVNCLFGLSLSGSPTTATSGTGSYDPTGGYSCPDAGWLNFKGAPNAPQVDRLPLEAVVGWDATVNGNLAEQLQEPSLMGAYEGAGITVLGKGVIPPAGTSVWTDGSEPGAFPIGTLLLQNVPAAVDSTGAPIGPQFDYCFTTRRNQETNTELNPNPYPSNFECNPSSIDGLSVTDSSQGGGGVFVHGWAHNLQIANNRVYNNAGTLSGGISVGQGEFPVAITTVATGTFPPAGESVLDAPPSCQFNSTIGTHLPYCLDMNVNVHNNYITSNSSLGDELFSGTLSGGGGVSFCTGSDYYKFQYNWVCGNLSSGEGGGLVHLGFIYNGDIENNSFLFNQSDNPTIPTNGGGVHIQGTPDTDPVCGSQSDADCPPGLSDGTGPGLVINANLIQGNMAESGSGGGIRLQQVNGTEVATFPKKPNLWNSVSITNNIITNNVAGWDGAGISLQDSLNVSIINNTIASNDTLASSGVLTQSIGTPMASAPAGNCVQPGPTGPTTASCPQSAGVTSTQNSTLLTTSIAGLTLTCPYGPGCGGFSNPQLQNNVIWQNRAFYVGVGNLGQGTLNQQNLVSLFNAFTGTAAPVQAVAGACSAGVSYWDIGVRGDTGPSNHHSGFTLAPTYSVLDDVADYPGAHNFGSNPAFGSQYCNGSRVPPTCTTADGCAGPSGYGVPPGIVDASAPNPIFSLTPSATVDEGNNWINVSWGPLDMSDPTMLGADGNYGGGPLFGNYALVAGSPAIDVIPTNQPHPTMDFFGNPRPDGASCFDVGAVEFQGGGGGNCSGGGGGGNVTFTPATWNPTATRGVGAGIFCLFGGPCQTFTLTNHTGATLTGIGNGVLSGTNASDYTIVPLLSSCGPAGGGQVFANTSLANGASCVVTVQFLPKSTDTAGTKTATISVTDSAGTQSASITGTAR